MIKILFKDNIIIYSFSLKVNNNLNALTIAEFEFLKENSKVWLNNCFVDETYRKIGVGTLMIKIALRDFKTIYFSSAEKGEHKRRNIENDSRYIEPPDGTKFIEALLENKTIKKEWIIDPFR